MKQVVFQEQQSGSILPGLIPSVSTVLIEWHPALSLNSQHDSIEFKNPQIGCRTFESLRF
ncbi:hypothetical protein FD737_06660 [Pantoea sp. Seng]|uniref:hypothetical protein n=1 Tax=Pantoea sp. Seng TaxID=2576761 RepID=UPI00132AADFD|nr:hypothetical protein [Pantoea sp. Seng]MXP52762.1 hypothetical protein [Pantoea sp. Seng]